MGPRRLPDAIRAVDRGLNRESLDCVCQDSARKALRGLLAIEVGIADIIVIIDRHHYSNKTFLKDAKDRI
jgi:hypothetical protein